MGVIMWKQVYNYEAKSVNNSILVTTGPANNKMLISVH